MDLFPTSVHPNGDLHGLPYNASYGAIRTLRDKKIAEIGRFLGEKSDFGGPGKDFAVEKSEKKNRRKIADFSDKNRFFPIKTDYYR